MLGTLESLSKTHVKKKELGEKGGEGTILNTKGRKRRALGQEEKNCREVAPTGRRPKGNPRFKKKIISWNVDL